jgi:subtilisin family serine protease
MRRIMRAGALVVAIGLAVAADTVASWSAPPPVGRAADDPPAGVATVTLVTGDVVELLTAGGRSAATVVAGRPGVAYRTETVNGQVRVVPSDAFALIDSGRVDPRLFNVSLLVELGYDDAHRQRIPLLATGGASFARPIGGTGIQGLSTEKSAAAQFWNQLRSPNLRSLAAGIDRLWLDGKAFVSLERSREQIGVPTAWQAGLTGQQVKVAVLDTGYDTRHPDLVGRVTASKDFTGSPEGIEDTVGHGTHVASIVGGSGAASAGAYRGVAPDTSLFVGKVCTDQGCPESAILDGMAWAVEQGAKVVNLSLGCDPRLCANDGSDPLSLGLNTLSSQSGALFVVAAGNTGRDSFVSTPAAADAALAVGSVDRQDAVSLFSSRGLRPGDFAVKPEITAPGEDIVAARAVQAPLMGPPVGDEYQTLTGTSMSTPHVTGAAAILAQQHPEWTGTQLKAELLATSVRSPSAPLSWQGAGRVDVARAVTQRVTADVGSFSYGTFAWPHTGQPPVSKSVTYHNDGDQAVTLNTSLVDSPGSPAGGFRLGQSSVTVPAHGTGTATMTVDPAGPTGLLSGWLVASTVDNTVRLSTAVSAYVEDERYELTVTVRHRDGTPATDCTAGVRVVLRVNGGYEEVTQGSRCTDGQAKVTVRTRPGHLAVSATAFPTDENRYATSLSTVAFPDISLAGDTAIVADARTAGAVTSSVASEPTARQSVGRMFWYLGNGDQVGEEIAGGGLPLYTTTVGRRADDFKVAYRATFAQPLVAMRVTGLGEFALTRNYPGGLLLGDRATSLVNAGSGTAAELARIAPAGKIVIVQAPGDPYAVIDAVAAAGALAVVLPLEFPFPMPATALPVLLSSFSDGDRLLAATAAGAVPVTTTGVRSSPYRYELAFTEQGGLPNGASYRVSRDQLALVKDSYHHAGPDVTALAFATAVLPDGVLFAGGTHRLLLPSQQRVYYTPGAVAWRSESILGDYGIFYRGRQTGPPTKYTAGKTTNESWFAAPFHARVSAPVPPADPTPWAFRSTDVIGVNLPVLSDANSNHYGLADPYFGDAGSVELSRDGVLIDRVFNPGQAYITVPSTPGTYTLHTEVFREEAPYWNLSPRVSTQWTFRSGRTNSPQALPLLDVDWRLPVDVANSVPARQNVDAEMMVNRQPGSPPAKVTSVTVKVSYDGANTWRSASVQKSGANWRVRIPGGGTPGGYADLRVTVSAADGSCVEETIIRAYALR